MAELGGEVDAAVAEFLADGVVPSLIDGFASEVDDGIEAGEVDGGLPIPSAPRDFGGIFG